MRRGTALLATLGALAFCSSAHAADYDYVGLGDSYSSGNGTASSYDDNCDRTNLSYPPLVGAQIAPASWVNRSCSGAKTNNITTDAQSPGNPQGQISLSGLGPGTKWVTLEIGGNDVGFSSVLTECGNPFGDCDAAVAEARQKGETELPGKLDATYAAVRNKAPNATIVVVGYPRIFRPNQSCNTFFSAHEVNELNAAADELDQIIRDRAHASSFAYVTAIPAFTGHGACDSDEWINGLTFTPTDNAYHPKATGHNLGYKPIVLAGIQNVPDTAIASKPPSPSNSSSPTFGLTSTIQNSTFQCKLDGGAYSSCGASKQYTGVTEGSHTFTARAVNPNGDVDQFPASYTWTVDLTPPPVTLAPGGPTGSVNTTTASFSFSTSDPTASLTCRLDAAAFAPCLSPKSYSGLADGQHTFTVQATDPAGNTGTASRTWTVDTTPPAATINSSPGDPTASSAASFSFLLDDPGATAQCSLDGAPYATCTSPQGYTGLADGPHTFAVRGVDSLANVGAPASFAWVVDTTASTVSIDSGPAALTNQTTANFAFSVDDPNAALTCRLDGGSFAPCDSAGSQSYSGLGDGAHSFTVRAIDQVGNSATDSYGWTVDTVKPSAAITSGPGGVVASTSADFSFETDDPTAHFECRLDAGSFAGCNSPKSYAGVGEGLHTFQVRSVDPADNIGQAASRSWTVDTVPPTTLITSHPGSLSASQSAQFAFSSSEPGSSFRCRLDSSDPSAYVPCGGPAQSASVGYQALADGNHSFDVVAVDPAGNASSSPASFTWRVDTTAPSVTLDATPAARADTGSAEFGFHAGEAGVSYQCSLDGGPPASCSSPRTYNLDDGGHSFAVRATDQAGNVGSAATYFWTIDTTAPTVTFDSGPAQGSLTRFPNAEFHFHASEEARRECKLAGPGIVNPQFGECDHEDLPDPTQGSFTRTNLADGTYTLTVKAKDLSDHEGTASRTWTVDTTAPVVNITSAPSGTTNSSTATVSFTAAGNPTVLECRLDSGAFGSCTSPKGYSGLADGPHTVTVRAMDAAGNEGSDARSWTVDTQPPETTIVNRPAASTTSTAATFSFTSSEAGSSFECSLDGALFSSCTSPVALSGLDPGDHSFRVRAVDPAGNRDASPAVAQWRIETPAPAPSGGDGGAGGGSPASGVAGQTGSSPKPAKCKKKKRRSRASAAAKKCSKRRR